MRYDLVVRGGTVVTPSAVRRCDVGVREGRIGAIEAGLEGTCVLDATGKLVLPGAIDAHTHMAARAGPATSADDFRTGTRAAAAGGVTTIIDFTSARRGRTLSADIRERIGEAEGAQVDFALHAEVVDWQPGREPEIEEALREGVSSFKFFTAYGSQGERSDSGALYHAFRAIAEAGGVAQVHAEDDPLIEAILERMGASEMGSMESLPRSRPPICEGLAITEVAYLAEKLGTRLHVCHVSSALGVEALQRAQANGMRITGETCPQYLLLTDRVYASDAAPHYSVMPPLRENGDTEALWRAVADGTIACVATDHCPFRRAQKRLQGSFTGLPYGLPGVETLLPLLYSEGVVRRRIELTDLPRLLADGPARIFGLTRTKGALEAGRDADIVVFDPEIEWTIAPERLHMNTDFSPYERMPVRGAVAATIVRGEVVYADGEFPGRPGRGRFVRCDPPGGLHEP